MKTLLFFTLIFLISCHSNGQTNYYLFNNDSLLTEKAVRSAFDKSITTLPSNYDIIPTVYHKIVKGDSIINYVTFYVGKSNSSINKHQFKFTFKQDSVFLFLNKKLPEFKLLDLQGNEFSSNKLIGKPTLLNYWAIYCGPCIAEMPELSGLKERYGSEMNFIALTENTCKDDNLINFLEKHPFNYQILQNAENYKKTLKIGAIPRNIFIDKGGYIRYIQGNFPYTKFEPANGIREYDKNNYFVKIIEELIKKQ